MNRICIIVNPAARGVQGRLARLSRLTRNVVIRKTQGPGDAEAQTERAVEQGFSTIVAAGGDGASPALSGVATLLAAELGRQPRSRYTVQRLLEVLCAEAIRAFQAQGDDGKAGWLRGLKDPKIAAALREVHARPGHAWTLETLANQAALSPSRFSARFREHVGQSVMGYVGRWRINVACRLLRQSDLPLIGVAIRVGYDSLPAFSRAFKAQAGIPPALWRIQAATQADCWSCLGPVRPP